MDAELSSGGRLKEPGEVAREKGDRRVARRETKTNGDERLTRPLLFADEKEGGIEANGNEADEGPDQDSDGKEHKETSKGIWIAELSPEEFGAEATAFGISELLLDGHPAVVEFEDKRGVRGEAGGNPPWLCSAFCPIPDHSDLCGAI